MNRQVTLGGAGRPWTRSEHLTALELYLRLPFGRIDRKTTEIVELADLLGRSANAVSMKLANFASLDPSLKARGIRGLRNRSADSEAIWERFAADRELLAFEAARARSELDGRSIEDQITTEDIEHLVGDERESVVRTRVNQHVFRRMILARYDETCCVTGLTLPELLVAGHIVPWADAPEERLNPRNGLCLNPLHDRAFERGLLTIDDDFRIVIAERVRDDASPAAADLLLSYHGESLRLPDAFSPDPELLRRHRERFAA